MTNKILLTPDQFIKLAICRFPTLYACDTFEFSKFRVLDQLLNVIGNGIRDDDELDEFIFVENVPDFSDYERYIKEEIFFGYENVRAIEGSNVLFPEGESITCLESNKHLYPNVKKWIHSKKIKEKAPYPNFKEGYSTVYRTNFERLGNEWIDAAIWFYQEAKVLLEQYESTYHYAYPCATERETVNRKADQIKMFGARTNEEISKDWEHPYDGDIEKFLIGKWQKEKTRIFEFIERTISYLEGMKR